VSGTRQQAVPVAGLGAVARLVHGGVDQCVGGPQVPGEHAVLGDDGRIGDPAQVQHGAAGAGPEQGVEHGGERCTLATAGKVRRTHVEQDAGPGRRGHPGHVADLQGAPGVPVGVDPVEQGLAVAAHQVRASRRVQHGAGDESQVVTDLGVQTGPVADVARGRGEHVQQSAAQVLGPGVFTGVEQVRVQEPGILAVALQVDQRGVHRVDRGPAHHPEYPHTAPPGT
jgi:hypothetical protein